MLMEGFRFFTWFFFLCAASSTVFAVPSNLDKNYFPYNNASFYTSASGGYGNFDGVLRDDGRTGILRLAIGTQFNVWPYTLFGTELGIQTGNRMRINSDDAIPAIGSAPIFLTIKPPIDALLTVAFHIKNTPLSVLAKAGAAYCQGMMDSATVANQSQVMPEVQLGLSVLLTRDISLIAYYQRLFGGTPKLINIDIDNGAAALNHLPTMQAGFVGIEKRF